MELIEKIKKEIQDFNQKRQDLVKELQKEFPVLFTPLFEKSKKIQSISWTQYTPYFNDGDSCEFSVHNDDLYVNGFHSDDMGEEEDNFISPYFYLDKIKTEEEPKEHIEISKEFHNGYKLDYKIGDSYGYKKNPNYDANEKEILDQIRELLQEIPEDFYEDLFGDHCEVTINKDGTISVKSYEHD